jgi:hypothetical protein
MTVPPMTVPQPAVPASMPYPGPPGMLPAIAGEPGRRRMSWAWFAGTAVVAAAALVAIGWQTHWPDAVFGPRHSQPAQLRAATGLGSSSAPASAPTSAASPAGSASLAAPAAPLTSAPPVTSAAPTTLPVTGSAAPTAPPPAAGGPAATVRAYYAAITAQDYARAWRLGGKYLGASYAEYVAGFSGTATDTVTISSVSGNVVTARLVATQTDGTVKTYQGAYTVTGGVITQFSVQQTS